MTETIEVERAGRVAAGAVGVGAGEAAGVDCVVIGVDKR